MPNVTYSLKLLCTSNYAQALNLYEHAFPKEERRKSEDWLHLHECNNNDFHILTILDENEFVGFLTFWQFKNFIYIEHFATLSNLRGKGIGSSILHQFIYNNVPRPIVLEVEPAENELCCRRITFYERLGFNLSPKPYFQPAYHKGESPLPLCLMSTNADYLSSSFSEIVHTIHAEVYGVQ